MSSNLFCSSSDFRMEEQTENLSRLENLISAGLRVQAKQLISKLSNVEIWLYKESLLAMNHNGWHEEVSELLKKVEGINERDEIFLATLFIDGIEEINKVILSLVLKRESVGFFAMALHYSFSIDEEKKEKLIDELIGVIPKNILLQVKSTIESLRKDDYQEDHGYLLSKIMDRVIKSETLDIELSKKESLGRKI